MNKNKILLFLVMVVYTGCERTFLNDENVRMLPEEKNLVDGKCRFSKSIVENIDDEFIDLQKKEISRVLRIFRKKSKALDTDEIHKWEGTARITLQGQSGSIWKIQTYKTGEKKITFSIHDPHGKRRYFRSSVSLNEFKNEIEELVKSIDSNKKAIEK